MRCCLEQPEVCQLFASIYVSLVHGDDGMRLEWTWFYDDYTMICGDDCASNVAWGAECVSELLGILFAKEGK